MAVKFSNNGKTTLASNITSSATSISVTDGSVFPTLSGGDTFYMTLEDIDSNIEIVSVTARSGNTLTVTRAQEGTTARAFSSADKAENRLTAAGLNSFVSDSGDTMAGDLIISNSAPQIKFVDTSTSQADDFFIHANNRFFFILTDRDQNGSYESPYPLQLSNSSLEMTTYGNTVWTTGNDGPGSGLDADTVDGIQASSFLQTSGGTLSGTLTITQNTDALRLYTATNAGGVNIEFSDNQSGSYAQQGQLTYFHQDGYSYGSGNAFVFSSTEDTMTLLVDGKLMYKEGIYSKPASGTGAGTRKDANWDTAYGWGNHASAGYITGLTFNNLTGKNAGTGDYSTDSDLVSGRGSGGVALTINDGYGNANVTFNHQNGTPEQDGQSARIEVNTDATTDTGIMYFEVSGASVTADTAVGLTNAFTLFPSDAQIPSRLSHMGDGNTYLQFDTDRIRLTAGGVVKFDSNNTYATESYVDTAVSGLVDSAPSTLDTLNELAAALGDDANFSTTVTNSIATKLPLAGGTLTGNLSFGDNDKAIFGAGSDLQIYHDGSQSIIEDVGTGQLKILAENTLYLGSATGTEAYIRAVKNSGVQLYFNNAEKISTTGSGINVTGTVVSDGQTVDGTALLNGHVFGALDSQLSGFLLPQNPEGKHLKSPILFNDLAYARLKGATISVDIDGTAMTSASEIDKMLNVSSDFFQRSTSGVSTITITVTDLPRTFTYTAYMGITFGNVGWRAKDITLKSSTDNGSTWTTRRTFTDQTEEACVTSFSSGSAATNALQFVLEDFNSSFLRIVSLFAYNYNSPGVEGIYMTRGGGGVYGDILLGSSTSIRLPNNDQDGIKTSDNYRVIDSKDSILRIGHTSKHDIIRLHGQGNDDFRVYFNATDHEIWHGGNDGSGSGLDADTVDGVQASSFLRSDADDTTTGHLTFSDSGYSIGNEYHTWKRSYVVNQGNPDELLYRDGNSLPNGGAYRFHAHIPGTGTDQSATAVYWKQNGTWKLNVTYQSGASSNHPEFIIDGGVPKISIDHATLYTVEVLGERLELSEGTGTDNKSGFGTDAYFSVNNTTLRFNPSGAGPINTGDLVWHAGNDGSGSGLDADKLDGQHGSYYQPAASELSWVDQATGDYGTIKVDDDRSVSWAGYAIRDDWVLMSNGADSFGIYNDTNNEWALKAYNNQHVDLYYNGGSKFRTTADGVRVVSTASNPDATTSTYEKGLTITGGNQRLNIDVSSTTNGGAYIQTRHSTSAYPSAYYELKLNPLGGAVSINGSTVWHAGNDGSGSGLDADTVDGSHASSFARNPANAHLNMSNFNIQNVNALTFNDPGPGEGIQWNGGNLWKIYESPNDLSTNSGGNLQFVKNTTRSMTLDTDGDLYVARNITAGGQKYPDFNTTGRFYLGNNDWSELISGVNNGYSATHQGVSFGSTSGPIPCRIPIDPSATYRITVRVKHISTSSGSGKFYFAVQTLNENFSNLASDTANSYNYGVASNQALTAGQVYTFSADFSGYNATNAGTATKFDPEGKYFDVYYITNYQGGGETVIQSVEVERISEGYLRADAFDTSSSGLYLQGGSYNAGTDTATAPLIIDEGDYIFTKDGGYLRKLIGKASDVIYIGQGGTALITQINFQPGNAGNDGVKVNGNTVWNAGNDGSGSGLDADTVDGLQPSSLSVSQANQLTGSAFATTGSPGSVLEYQQAASQTDTKLAPNTEWHNTIRLGHGNPYSYYSNTLAMRMTGTGAGGIFTQLISNNTALGWRTVWDSGNDGGGSGLDADTVDGLHASSFEPASATIIHQGSDIGSQDWNTFIDGTEASWNTVTNMSGSNKPPNYTYGQSLSISKSGQAKFQLYASHTASAGNGLYYRSGWNTDYKAWVEIWDSGNDGSGSGLDADTVDGVQASSFLRSDADDTFSRDLVSNARNRGIFGVYDSYKTDHIWSMGTGYRNHASGTDFGNLYGLAYKHTNNTTGGTMGGSHQMVWCISGTPKCSLGSGIWTSGNVTAYSDIRVKTNIELIPDALDKVCQLNGYTFDRTDITYDEHGVPEVPIRQTGVIAQEVLEHLPEAVIGDEEGHYSVAYGNMVGLLIEAIKELKTEVDDLKTQLAEKG